MSSNARLNLRPAEIVLALLLVSSLAAGCGGEKSNSQPGRQAAAATAPAKPAFDYCTLLTKEEVEAAVGWKVTGTELSGRGDYGHCTYAGRTDPMVMPPEKVEAGVLPCVTNMPCTSGLPDFRSSADMVQYRKKGYEEANWGEMNPSIVAVDGLGVPAIDHELASMRSIEMQIGHQRVAYVSTWGASGPARELAKKVLARAR